MENVYYTSANGKNTVHACIWKPQGEICGVVQIIHGMSEYAERYAPLAKALAKRGFLVCADDHLGHGKTAENLSDLGHMGDGGDYKTVLQDIRKLTHIAKKYAPDKKYFVLGHSMGSFFCRAYIAEYGAELCGAVVMGTGFKSRATLNSALFITNLVKLFRGARYKSKGIKSLAFGSYNKKFKPVRTEYDWLSKNPENVDNYLADELCGQDFTLGGYKVLFSVIKRACSQKAINAVPENLPVLFVAGAEDPVGDYGKGVLKAAEKFKKAGVKDVRVKLYENCRHEILNDDCKEQATSDVLEFFTELVNG